MFLIIRNILVLFFDENDRINKNCLIKNFQNVLMNVEITYVISEVIRA